MHVFYVLLFVSKTYICGYNVDVVIRIFNLHGVMKSFLEHIHTNTKMRIFESRLSEDVFGKLDLSHLFVKDFLCHH